MLGLMLSVEGSYRVRGLASRVLCFSEPPLATHWGIGGLPTE